MGEGPGVNDVFELKLQNQGCTIEERGEYPTLASCGPGSVLCVKKCNCVPRSSPGPYAMIRNQPCRPKGGRVLSCASNKFCQYTLASMDIRVAVIKISEDRI